MKGWIFIVWILQERAISLNQKKIDLKIPEFFLLMQYSSLSTQRESEKVTFSNVCNTIKTGLIEAFWKLTLMWRCSHLHSINSLKQWNIWSNRVMYTTKHDAMQLTIHLSINAYIHFYMEENEVFKKSYKWHPDEVTFFSSGRTKKNGFCRMSE